ncbi:MAG: outer membrane protein assembly factor BamB family protein, partial [Candidatus Latescibacterota bacterium]
MNKQFTPLVLLLFLGFLSPGCSGGGGSEKGANTREPASWPIFRGDRNLSGVAGGTLPDAMKLLWSRETGTEIVSSPVIGIGSVFIGSKDGKVYSLRLPDGTIQWVFDSKDDIEASPLLLDRTIYIGNLSGILFALDAHTGRERWRAETGGDIMGSASWATDPESGGKRILAGSYDSKMYC